jgi:hypothetical protein
MYDHITAFHEGIYGWGGHVIAPGDGLNFRNQTLFISSADTQDLVAPCFSDGLSDYFYHPGGETPDTFHGQIIASLAYFLYAISMEFKFYKIFLGEQDFILINGFANTLPKPERMKPFVEQLCRRRTGVGGRGLMVLTRDSEHSAALTFYSQGGEEEEPGASVLMCAGRYAFDYGLAQNEEIVFQTIGGPRSLQCIDSSHFSCSLGSPATFGEKELFSTEAPDYQVLLESRNERIRCIPVYFSERFAAVYLSGRHTPSQEELLLNKLPHSPVYYRVLDREEIEIPFSLMEGTDCIEAAAAAGTAAVVNGFCERDLDILYMDHERLFFEWNERSNTIFVTATPHYAFAGSYTFDEDG